MIQYSNHILPIRFFYRQSLYTSCSYLNKMNKRLLPQDNKTFNLYFLRHKNKIHLHQTKL